MLVVCFFHMFFSPFLSMIYFLRAENTKHHWSIRHVDIWEATCNHQVVILSLLHPQLGLDAMNVQNFNGREIKTGMAVFFCNQLYAHLVSLLYMISFVRFIDILFQIYIAWFCLLLFVNWLKYLIIHRRRCSFYALVAVFQHVLRYHPNPQTLQAELQAEKTRCAAERIELEAFVPPRVKITWMGDRWLR